MKRRMSVLVFACLGCWTASLPAADQGQQAVEAPAQQKLPQDLTVKLYTAVLPVPVSPEGFVDNTNQFVLDSLKDLQKALSKEYIMKSYWAKPDSFARTTTKLRFVLVAEPTKADMVLTVAARGTSVASFGTRTTMDFYRGVVLADTVPTAAITRWVSLVMEVGSYRREFVTSSTNGSGWSLGAWKADAGLLAQMVAGWVILNEDQMRLRQAGKS